MHIYCGRKGLAVAAVALFVGLTLAPAGGLTETLSGVDASMREGRPCRMDGEQDVLTVTVEEHRPDGTMETWAVSCTGADVERMTRELQMASNTREAFRVLAAHGLIQADGSHEMLAAIREQTGMTADVQDIWLPPLAIMFFSEVSMTYRWGGTIRLGMTPFLRLINRYLKTDLQRGVDLVDVCWGLRGSLHTRGLLGEHRLTLRPGMSCMAGFIGYGVHIPLLRHSFYGAAVMTVTAGLGEHDFDPWFPN